MSNDTSFPSFSHNRTNKLDFYFSSLCSSKNEQNEDKNLDSQRNSPYSSKIPNFQHSSINNIKLQESFIQPYFPTKTNSNSSNNNSNKENQSTNSFQIKFSISKSIIIQQNKQTPIQAPISQFYDNYNQNQNTSIQKYEQGEHQRNIIFPLQQNSKKIKKDNSKNTHSKSLEFSVLLIRLYLYLSNEELDLEKHYPKNERPQIFQTIFHKQLFFNQEKLNRILQKLDYFEKFKYNQQQQYVKYQYICLSRKEKEEYLEFSVKSILDYITTFKKAEYYKTEFPELYQRILSEQQKPFDFNKYESKQISIGVLRSIVQKLQKQQPILRNCTKNIDIKPIISNIEY